MQCSALFILYLRASLAAPGLHGLRRLCFAHCFRQRDVNKQQLQQTLSQTFECHVSWFTPHEKEQTARCSQTKRMSPTRGFSASMQMPQNVTQKMNGIAGSCSTSAMAAVLQLLDGLKQRFGSSRKTNSTCSAGASYNMNFHCRPIP